MTIASIIMFKLKEEDNLQLLVEKIKIQAQHQIDINSGFLGCDIYEALDGGSIILITKWSSIEEREKAYEDGWLTTFFNQMETLTDGYGLNLYKLISYIRINNKQTLETVTPTNI